jgi:hypothetical protein
MKKVEEARKVFEESKSEIMLPDVFRINVPAMVFADPHIPFHSVPMMTRAIAVAEVNNIRRLCVDGDFVDNHFISDVFRESQSSSKMTGDEAYEVAEDIIGVLLKTFTGGIWFLEGNHEAWGEKILHGRLKIKTLAKMFGVDGKAKISPFDHGYVGDWCVIHGKNYSGIHPTTPPLRYCRIKDCSCIQGHQHLSGEAYTENGKHVAVPMGCMCDPKNMEYVQRKTTTNPKWMGEFVIIDGENRIHRFIDHPQKTNWNYVENVRTIR